MHFHPDPRLNNHLIADQSLLRGSQWSIRWATNSLLLAGCKIFLNKTHMVGKTKTTCKTKSTVSARGKASRLIEGLKASITMRQFIRVWTRTQVDKVPTPIWTGKFNSMELIRTIVHLHLTVHSKLNLTARDSSQESQIIITRAISEWFLVELTLEHPCSRQL